MLGHFFDFLLTRFRIFPVGFVKILSHDSVVLDAVHIRLFTPRSFTNPGVFIKFYRLTALLEKKIKKDGYLCFMDTIFETPRLRVRPWQESDAQALFRYASEPEVGERAGRHMRVSKIASRSSGKSSLMAIPSPWNSKKPAKPSDASAIMTMPRAISGYGLRPLP